MSTAASYTDWKRAAPGVRDLLYAFEAENPVIEDENGEVKHTGAKARKIICERLIEALADDLCEREDAADIELITTDNPATGTRLRAHGKNEVSLFLTL